MSVYERLRHDVLGRLDEARLDPERDHEELAALVRVVVAAYQAEAASGAVPALRDPDEMRKRITSSIVAYGPLTELLERQGVEEVFVEGERVTFVDGSGRLQRLDQPVSAEETSHLVARLLAATERRLDVASPIVQARVLDGSARLTAVIPPVADRLSATLRRYALRRETLEHLVECNAVSEACAGFLRLVMQVGSSIVVSGPPGAGKTSLLAALLAAAPLHHCIRCVEEVRELNVELPPHSSFYQARPPAIDGGAAVTVRDLVKLVLAMRPDRIVVGEVRGAEAFELTRASNAGCGFCCTVHANGARHALDALVNAALMAGENVTEAVVRKVFASTIDLIVHVERDHGDGDRPIRRGVTEVVAVSPSIGDGFTTEPIFARSAPWGRLEWTGALPPEDLNARLESAGRVSVRSVCEGAV